jgi:ArsR family transcriptional regulator, arsenate/arsenite/antimonite-responsive transcriptional repressor
MSAREQARTGAAGDRAKTAGGGEARGACCPLPPGVAPLPLERPADDAVLDLAAVGKALSDPIRLRMLSLMTEAARCCRPAPETAGSGAVQAPAGVCVCELQGLYGLAQSKVSYHLKVLREAGLVREARRGRWSFYSVDEDAAAQALAGFARRLGV